MHDPARTLPTIKSSDGKSHFSYAMLYDNHTISACQEWFGVIDLESLFETVDKLNAGHQHPLVKLLQDKREAA